MIQLQNEVHHALARLYAQKVKDLPDSPEGLEAAEQLRDSLRLKVQATGSKGKFIRQGGLKAIFDQTVPSDIEALRIANSQEARTGQVVLSFAKTSEAGTVNVQLLVSGRDRPWVDGTAGILSTEIEKGVPRWAFLRHGFASYMFAILVVFGIAGLLKATLWDLEDSSGLILAATLPIFSVFLAIPVHAVAKRVLPGFEIREPGASNAGRKLLVGVVAGVGFLASLVGIAVGISDVF